MALSEHDRPNTTAEADPDREPGRRFHTSPSAHLRQALIRVAPEPAILSASLTIGGLLQALRRRWLLACLLGLFVGSGCAAVVWFTQKEAFTARTIVHVAASSPTVVAPAANTQADFANVQRNQLGYVKSRMVLNAALHDAKVAPLPVIQEQLDPVAWLEKQLVADFSIGPEFLRIQISGDTPEHLSAIVAAVREAYLKEVRLKESTSREKRLRKLNEIWSDFDRRLSERRGLLRQMAEDLGSIKDAKVIERNQELFWKTLDTLQRSLVQTQEKLYKAQMEQELKLKQGPSQSISPTLIDEAIEKNDAIKAYRGQMAKCEREMEDIKKSALQPEQEPAFKRAKDTFDSAQNGLATVQEKLRENLKRFGSDKAAPQNLDADIESLTKQIGWLEDKLNKRMDEFKVQKKKQVDAEWIRAEMQSDDELAKRINDQRTLLGVEMNAEDRFSIMELEYVTADPDSRLKKAGMAGGGALALVVFLVSFFEFRCRRVSNVNDVVDGLKFRFVGSIPLLRTGTRGKPKAAAWREELMDSIEKARTVLLHAAQSESLQVFVVTSAVGGEGKTLTSSQLAASLARAGRKTLLVDADLRRPALQKVFSLRTSPGFAELLRGEVAISETLQAGPVAELSIISAGHSDERSIQALSQSVLADLFNALRTEFDFVVVDSAPVLPVADSQLVCQQADGVIFSVLRDVSRLPLIYAAHERLVSLRARILGAVVNGATGPVYGTMYQYGRNAPSSQSQPMAACREVT